MKVQVSIEMDRPVADVWHFWAVEHVRNHPRWDPDIELEQISEANMDMHGRATFEANSNLRGVPSGMLIPARRDRG